MPTKHSVAPPWVAEMIEGLAADHREAFEERAGIMEHDGKLSREYAEYLALLDVIRRHPAALIGVKVLQIELDGGTQWLLTTDLAYARRYLLDVGATEIGEVDLSDVIEQQYGGIALLTTLG